MKYELMVILSPKQTDKEIEKLLKEIKGTLTENGFDITDEDLWGMRDLAYKVSTYTRGYYAVMTFAGEPEGVPAVHKDLRLQVGLIRYLLTKVPNDYVLMRYEGTLQMAKTANAKLSSPAEELSKKVRSKKPKAEKAEDSKEKNEELDEKLKAIIEDKDII